MELFRLICLLAGSSPIKAKTLKICFGGQCEEKTSPFFEIDLVLVRLDHVGHFIVDVDHNII